MRKTGKRLKRFKHLYLACFYFSTAWIVWRFNQTSLFGLSDDIYDQLAGMHSAIQSSNIVLNVLIIVLFGLGAWHTFQMIRKGAKGATSDDA
ncbi:hypothetical protein [Vibrio gangliei]|uniref:hypothetical protein n=1 Tax=Vibrio gangliei TaxID=2077090 RepID=UPI000D012DC9|nr:hypothetical protein [Vibrio gangliei]